MSPSRILRISKTTSSSRRKEKEKGEGEHGVDHAVADDAALECVWDVAGHKHACYNEHNACAHIEETDGAAAASDAADAGDAAAGDAGGSMRTLFAGGV